MDAALFGAYLLVALTSVVSARVPDGPRRLASRSIPWTPSSCCRAASGADSSIDADAVDRMLTGLASSESRCRAAPITTRTEVKFNGHVASTATGEQLAPRSAGR